MTGDDSQVPPPEPGDSRPGARRSGARQTGGRRSAARRGRTGRSFLDPTVLAAVLLTLVAVGVMLLAGTQPAQQPDQAPSDTPLARSTLVCPAALTGRDGEVLVAAAGDADGAVQVRSGAGSAADGGDLALAAGRTSTLESAADLSVSAQGALAAQLVASRVATAPLEVAECRPGTAEAWFTGVGAGARHSSVLALTNPGSGQAVVDVQVLGASGPVEADDLVGVVVPGGETVRVDLAAQVPRRDELALRVVTTRGRVAASLSDTVDRLGRSAATRDWLLAQAAPARLSTLLGVPRAGTDQVLTLANGGSDEVRAEIGLVTGESTFAPADLEEVRVPPGGVTRLSLDAVLGGTDGVLGLQVRASAPVTAALRALSRGDLTHLVPGEPLAEPASVLVPRGEKRVVLGAADAVGVVTLEALAADGSRLATERVEVGPERAASIDLPRAAVQVRLSPERASVQAAVVVRGDGVATLPVRTPVTSDLVPGVRPGLT